MNFKNSPIITSELSKFLALNTNVEAVEKMQKQMSIMKTEHASIKKEIKSVSSAVATTANKWDSTFKPAVDDLKKRVRQLESKA